MKAKRDLSDEGLIARHPLCVEYSMCLDRLQFIFA